MRVADRNVTAVSCIAYRLCIELMQTVASSVVSMWPTCLNTRNFRQVLVDETIPDQKEASEEDEAVDE